MFVTPRQPPMMQQQPMYSPAGPMQPQMYGSPQGQPIYVGSPQVVQQPVYAVAPVATTTTVLVVGGCVQGGSHSITEDVSHARAREPGIAGGQCARARAKP
jgi:hypothetical protein